MTRTAVAAWMVAAIFFYSSAARGQPAIVSVQDADPPLDEQQPDLLALPTSAPPPCCCRLVPVPGEPSEAELTAVVVAGAAAATISYLFAAILISQQPHSVPTVDAIPVVGTIVAAQRYVLDPSATPLLLFSAGVQAIGILVAGVGAAELAARRRLMLDVGASATGAGVGVTWRF